eukprot:m.115173 g.115173  ORF g.115173 m.115173 type:complete len:659 (-) comp19381_c0_seq4:28-2004(-)
MSPAMLLGIELLLFTLCQSSPSKIRVLGREATLEHYCDKYHYQNAFAVRTDLGVLEDTALFLASSFPSHTHTHKKRTQMAAKRSKLPCVRVGGVPEHFNLAWHLGIERNIFDKHGVEVQFQDIKEGTGAMIQALKDDKVDVIVALTEGLVADIAKGSDLRLLGTYVNTPLCWAISTGAQSAIHDTDDLAAGKTFAISRYGSGSHLMALVLATQRGWTEQPPQFKVVGNFQQLRDSVNSGDTDCFMWEHFTTKPFHDSGEVRRVGDITTPWPCFMLAARVGTLESKGAELRAMLAGIHESAQVFHAEHDTMPDEVARRYGLQPEDAHAWYDAVHIAAERFISVTALERAVEALKAGGVLASELQVSLDQLVAPGFGELRKDIKAMRLYSKPELVSALYRTLKHKGMAAGPLSYKELCKYDHNIYFGSRAVDALVDEAKIQASSRVVNIGSGMGGPARYMAGKVGCQVLACELQQDLHNTALELTERTQLTSNVHHVSGDFLQLAQHLQRGAYDHVVSWLTILHIADRLSVFRHSYDLLRPGGVFFSADFVALGHLTNDEWEILKTEVGCPSLAASQQTYNQELETAGFKIIKSTDVTEKWREYTKQRVADYEAAQEQLVSEIGEDIYRGLLRFYTTVRDLFAGGRLGGLEVYAQKPLGW